MDQFPDTKIQNNLDSLNIEEIKKLYSFCPENKKKYFCECLNLSNKALLKKLEDGNKKVESLKNLNKLLLEKTWEFIDKDHKKEAALFFENLSKEFK